MLESNEVAGPKTVVENLLVTDTTRLYTELFKKQSEERIKKALKKEQMKKQKMRQSKNPNWMQGYLFPEEETK